MKCIDKSALVAEIERRIKSLQDCKADTTQGYAGEISGLKRLLSFIDTIEVKEVQEESVNKDLEEAAFDYAEACKYDGVEKLLCVEHFKDGAKWQQLMSNTLPSIPL